MNKQSLSNNPLCQIKVEVRCESIMHVHLSQPQLATLWTISSPSIVQMTSNLGQGGAQSQAERSIFHHNVVPIWYEIFQKIMQRIKFRAVNKRLAKSLLASHM